MNIIKLKDIKKIENGCGVIKEILGTESLGMAHVVVTRKFPPHFHKKMTEVYYVLEGNGFVEIDGNKSTIEKGDTIVISPNSWHTS